MHSNFVKRLLKAAWVLELVVAVLILAVTCWSCSSWGGNPFPGAGGELQRRRLLRRRHDHRGGHRICQNADAPHSPGGHDVLLFAIARQLVVNHSSAVDTLLGVAAVALIFVIKKFLHTDGDDAPAGDGRP